MSKKRQIFWWSVILIPSYLLIAFGTLFVQWANRPVTLTQGEVLITLPKKASLYTLSEELEQRGLTNSAMFFHLWVKLHRHSFEHFLAGTYRFTDTTTPKEIVRTMIEGKTYNPIVLEYTIPEGATYAQIQSTLLQFGIGTEDEYRKLAANKVWLGSMGLKGLEGFLFPATYRFFSTKPSAKEVLERAVKEFFVRIPENYKEQIAAHSMTLEQWVTFASLIERETPWDQERRFISEVIWSRLKAGMSLGIDAALIYGIKDFNGDITREHLQDRSNLYNTRIYRGLPPTPIASPSLASLEAVLSPVEEGYYYFVLVPGPERKHHFSKNLQEHNLFVRELVKATRLAKP